MLKERIHILVDRSRDSSWSDALINLEPDDIYKVTDNRNYLDWLSLKNYDVLAICGYSTIEYKDDELQAIEQFVRLGGGLLLASNMGKFERDVGKPISDMQLNKIAQIFGAEFLPIEACKGKLEIDDDLTCGYTKDNFWLADRAIFSYIDVVDIPFSNCGIISYPENADIVIRHKETIEAIGVCISYGEGRVLIISDTAFAQRSQKVCRSFIDWLARNRFSKTSSDESIPDEIPAEEYTIEDDKIRITYNEFVSKERVDVCLNSAKKILEYLSDLFPDELKQTWDIELTPSCTYESSQSRIVNKGAYMGDHQLASVLMFDCMMRVGILRDLAFNIFDREVFIKYAGIMGMRLLGFDQEADRMYFEILRQLNEKDPTGKEFDISRYCEYHPKLAWVLVTLTDKYGHDIFSKMSNNISDIRDLWIDTPSYVPRQVFSKIDTFIHYLSLVVAEDIYDWFISIGTNVHRLPVCKDDSDEFKNGVLQYLKDAIRNKSLNVSEREDAIYGLIYIYDKNGAFPFETKDRYDRIIWAIGFARLCDSKAINILRELALNDDDIGISAIASLEMIRLGDGSAANRLIELAQSLDYRFQIDAYHALDRIGYNLDESKPVINMEVDFDGVWLKIYPTLDGERVGNVFSCVDQIQHFPKNTHVTGVYIDWVRTIYKYRRLGISSEAMRQTFAHPAIKRCSCVALSTGVENPAHSIYKGLGFVDISKYEIFLIELKEEKPNIPERLVIRQYQEGDEIKMSEIANQVYSDLLDVSLRIKAKRYRGDNKVVKIAEKDGDMLGYVSASTTEGKDEAELNDICLKNADDLGSIGAILLQSLHSDLASKGFKRIMFWNDLTKKEEVRKMLNMLGYYSRFIGGVRMFKIINLPMLLEELTPLLHSRIANSDYKDWQGRIGICGEQHKATMIIDNGEISITEELLSDIDIMLMTNDDTITQIVVGKIDPFDAYLQKNLIIKPIVNDKISGLLKQLFPKMPI